MEHKKLSFETGDIHYYISKKDNLNKTILFTHGLTADYSMFAKQVEYFQNKYNIILWDMPLHGMSKNYKLFSYNSLADIIYKILTHEGIDKIILSGMSMGGYPCQYFIYKYPNMAEGFIAIDTTPLGFKYYSKLDLPQDVIDDYFKSKKTIFNEHHNIQVMGFDVEVGNEDVNTPLVVSKVTIASML